VLFVETQSFLKMQQNSSSLSPMGNRVQRIPPSG